MNWKPRHWLFAWAELLEALIGVVTVGFYRPNWSMKAYVYFLEKDVKAHKAKEEAKCSVENIAAVPTQQ